MGKTLGVLFCILVLFSCKKDQVPCPCAGVSMEGDRDFFVDTWRWYSTTVEEWFDLGPSVYYDYTPITEGYDYYFTISSDGIYRGYQNDILVQEKILSTVDYENYSSGNLIQFNMDCSNELIDLRHSAPNVTLDSIRTITFPLQFDDQDNHLRTLYNYFVRE